MTAQRHWTLGGKLALVGAPFLLLALLSIALTLWVSWQLDGGAAAVNEAGRMRMQAYRMSLSVGTGETQALPQQMAEFDASLNVLRNGDAERPLFVPWDDALRKRNLPVGQCDAVRVPTRVGGVVHHAHAAACSGQVARLLEVARKRLQAHLCCAARNLAEDRIRILDDDYLGGARQIDTRERVRRTTIRLGRHVELLIRLLESFNDGNVKLLRAEPAA
ncbi:MAG: hypothetical protein EBR07_11890, partial [Planctomycetes bacterium]|nr:hypothetical protein [Planctomycetota bacterium]